MATQGGNDMSNALHINPRGDQQEIVINSFCYEGPSCPNGVGNWGIEDLLPIPMGDPMQFMVSVSSVGFSIYDASQSPPTLLIFRPHAIDWKHFTHVQPAGIGQPSYTLHCTPGQRPPTPPPSTPPPPPSKPPVTCPSSQACWAGAEFGLALGQSRVELSQCSAAYAVVPDAAVTWTQAKARCAARGAVLARLNGMTDLTRLTGAVENPAPGTWPLMFKKLWLGGSDLTTEGEWRWIDDEQLDNGAHFFDGGCDAWGRCGISHVMPPFAAFEGYPELTGTDSSDMGSKDCLAMAQAEESALVFYDLPCHEAHGFVCEFRSRATRDYGKAGTCHGSSCSKSCLGTARQTLRWILGATGTSCDHTCSSEGTSCVASSWPRTSEQVVAAASAAGMSCLSISDRSDLDSVPMINLADAYGGQCIFSSSRRLAVRGTCNGQPSDAKRRLCPCM